MWTYEHRENTTAPAQEIWQLWSDVAGWADWNPGIESVTVDREFGVGAKIGMTDADGETVEVEVVEVAENERFVDQAVFGELTIRTHHGIEDGEIVYRMQITGEGADEVGPEIGPQITSDFPDVAAALARHAEHADQAAR